MGEELHFSVGIFTVLIVLDDDGELVDAQCDCDAWGRNQERPVKERSCDHIFAAKCWIAADEMDIELDDKLEREVV